MIYLEAGTVWTIYNQAFPMDLVYTVEFSSWWEGDFI